MTEAGGILIRNIFHMLAYALRGLQHKDFSRLSAEPFEHMEDLMAEILLLGLNRQIKQGLFRTYVPNEDELRTVRGRLLLSETMRSSLRDRTLLACSFEEFSADNLLNRILKAAARILLQSKAIRKDLQVGLQKALAHFQLVGDMDLGRVAWSKIRFSRETETYELLINVCRLIHFHALHSHQPGKFRLEEWFDESSLAKLYERFLVGYFRKHHPKLHAGARNIDWALAEGAPPPSLLPAMKADLLISCGKNSLIIDAKFYSSTLQMNYGKPSFISANLYQIFSYVKNYQASHPELCVSGMLLYARTVEELQPDDSFVIEGNSLFLRTLDLNRDFGHIRRALDAIAAGISRQSLE